MITFIVAIVLFVVLTLFKSLLAEEIRGRLDRLPGWVTTVAWFTPLYHLVQITRPLVLGPHLWPVLGNTIWLVVLTAGLYFIPVRAMRRRLIA